MTKSRTELLLQRIAGTAITVSTARGQGPTGTMKAGVDFLYPPALLARFNESKNPASYLSTLDFETEKLRKTLPICIRKDGTIHGQYWATARKFLNIFLLECTLNRYVCEQYENLALLERWLEVPLDSIVGEHLSQEEENREPRFCLMWNTIKDLSKANSDRYQELAQIVADRKQMPRVHLDLLYLAYTEAVEQP